MNKPPRWPQKLLHWWGDPTTVEEVQGDLLELYVYWVETVGERRANWRYGLSVLKLLRPLAKRKRLNNYPSPFFLSPDMLRNYLKIARRNLVKHKGYSFINIGGLAVGMAVAMLIGLWIYDELSVNKYHQNYDRIAQVMRSQTANGEIVTAPSLPIPLVTELQTTYRSNFKHVVLAWWTSKHSLVFGNRVFSKSGKFMTPNAPDMLSLKMIKGSREGLNDPSSILLSESVANALFGKTDPLHKVLKIDNAMTVKVTGIYEDLPVGSSFADVRFIAPWDLYAASTDWVKDAKDSWYNTSFEIFVELIPKASAEGVTSKIRNLLVSKNKENPTLKPELFLYPMSHWHLYSEWKNGVNVGGRIQFVWLFGCIGLFVLLLACINFINLTTARSVNRAKEVGIRKAVGSRRSQLIGQFFGESLLVVSLAYSLSLVAVFLAIPYFNQVADKSMVMPWNAPAFWLAGIGFAIFTGILAGSYPAFYLSSFRPIDVLKGLSPTRAVVRMTRPGRKLPGNANPSSGFRIKNSVAIPRQILVVIQFAVSVTLIIGTIVVYQQIQHAKNRPIGYSRDGLITLLMNAPGFGEHREAIREELIKSGAVLNLAESASPTTEVRSSNSGFDWSCKVPSLQADFATTGVSHEFGQTVGWQFKQGRDFSRQFSTDSSGMVVNESAVQFMGLRQPVGETITWKGEGFAVRFRILGVIKDMVMASPYEPVQPSVFFIAKRPGKFLTMRLNPQRTAQATLSTIEAVLKKHLPDAPFDYIFVNEEFNQKFRSEERIDQLAGLFAGLAIFISCLGLFGLASFMTEQRTKEIGVRKVLGASVLNLWGLLSKDFVLLVMTAFAIATPIAYYFLDNWLQKYAYRTEISWWIFVASGAGALIITLLTVSYQSIKAALMNPVKSLRSE
jgi:putative ABC transport system permease protein